MSAARVFPTSLALAFASVAFADGVVFEGYDPLWQAQTVIVEHDGAYYMDGEPMDELRHRNMPAEGLSLAMRDRIGNPDNYFLVRHGRLEIYTNCEHGPCQLKRSITASR